MYYSKDTPNAHSPYETTLPKELFHPKREFPPLFYGSCFISNLDEVVRCDDMAGNDPAYTTVMDGEYF